MYCKNCGNELSEDAKFCSNCGIEVKEKNENKREMVFEGKIHKCPNCGEILDSFTVKCPTCNFEFRDNSASNSVKEFAMKIEKIDESRTRINSKKNSVLNKIFGNGSNLSEIDEQKISLIRSFVIPNNKEDIFEFMILASSNIDFKLYGLGDRGIVTASQRAVSDAWIAKFEQAYMKAEMSLKNTNDFIQIQKIYNKTIKKLKFEKLMLPMVIIVPIGILFVIFKLLLCIM